MIARILNDLCSSSLLIRIRSMEIEKKIIVCVRLLKVINTEKSSNHKSQSVLALRSADFSGSLSPRATPCTLSFLFPRAVPRGGGVGRILQLGHKGPLKLAKKIGLSTMILVGRPYCIHSFFFFAAKMHKIAQLWLHFFFNKNAPGHPRKGLALPKQIPVHQRTKRTQSSGFLCTAMFPIVFGINLFDGKKNGAAVQSIICLWFFDHLLRHLRKAELREQLFWQHKV